MRDIYITIHYEDTDWKDDIAQFTVPKRITPDEIVDKIEQCCMEKRPGKDEGKMEYTQRIILDVAEDLGGSVFIFTIGGTLTVV